jgi:hypothetical protein
MMMKRLRKIGRYLITCGLICALVACAAAPPPLPVKKVQTVEELLTKLKKAFDTGTITDPDFYAKELGYPLKGPLTYSPDTVPDINRIQEIPLTEGALKGTLLRVQTGLSPDDRKFLQAWVSYIPNCFRFQDILGIWGNTNLKQVPDQAISHRHGATNPPLFYAAEKKIAGATHNASFSIGSKDYCLSDVSVSENF